jgi:hypothetical protein
VRLLEQALSDLGFHDAAAQLQRESGIALEPPTVERLRNAVKQGAFDKAVTLVGQLQLGSPAQMQHAQFLLLEQKYLEVRAWPRHSLPRSARFVVRRAAVGLTTWGSSAHRSGA